MRTKKWKHIGDHGEVKYMSSCVGERYPCFYTNVKYEFIVCVIIDSCCCGNQYTYLLHSLLDDEVMFDIIVKC